MIAYKIIEFEDGKVKTLFHGVNGSRTLKMNEWIKAKEIKGRDGSGDRWYLTGWHCFYTFEEAKSYLKAFRTRKEKLKIAEVEVKNIRKKEHSPSNVILCSWLKINKIIT